MFAKILVCSDGSDQALQAAKQAAELARRLGSEIVAVNVFDPAGAPVPFVGVPGTAAIASNDMGVYAREVQCAVQDITGQIFKEAGVPYRFHAECGHPVDRILSVATDEKADLIVLGSRGLSDLHKRLLGSVSDGVLHHAHCPVLIIR